MQTPTPPPPPPAFQPPRVGVRWEYLIVAIEKSLGFKTSMKEQHAARLNELGAQGWELVAMTADGGAGGLGATGGHSLVFKRQVA